jgi:hypothetical protein
MGYLFSAPHLDEISIQIKNGRGKSYPILPDNELFTFWQIIYLTPCIYTSENKQKSLVLIQNIPYFAKCLRLLKYYLIIEFFVVFVLKLIEMAKPEASTESTLRFYAETLCFKFVKICKKLCLSFSILFHFCFCKLYSPNNVFKFLSGKALYEYLNFLMTN